MPELPTTFLNLNLQTPVIAAAGTAGYVRELPEVVDPKWLGAIVTKSITREPREGNPPWRLIDLPRGMLNAIGLANCGMDGFLREKLPHVADAGTTIIASIAGDAVDDYVSVAGAFDEAEALVAVELNVSCPNTSNGLQFGENPRELRSLLAEVRPALTKTKLIVKLSPNVGDITAMAEAAIEGGADALTLINTVSAMAIDVETKTAKLSRGSGGMSGPAIHPLAVRMVSQVYRNVAKAAGVPLIGLGGVMTWQDAAEFILAGATAVGVGTALFVDPTTPRDVVRGLQAWIRRQGVQSINELVGAADIP